MYDSRLRCKLEGGEYPEYTLDIPTLRILKDALNTQLYIISAVSRKRQEPDGLVKG